jgi:hypothetical protein
VALPLSTTSTRKIDVRKFLPSYSKTRSPLFKTSRSETNEVPVIILCLDSLKERVQ